MVDWLLTVRVLLGLGMLGALWMIVSGLMDMQRINTQDQDVLELLGTLRRLEEDGRNAQLTVTTEDEVLHVTCRLPGKHHALTDLVPVLWRKGSMEAVAVATITRGQRRFLMGILLLAAAAAGMLLL